MAKKTKAELFKAKAANNFTQVTGEFERLETFIEDSSDIPAHAKPELKNMVKGYQDRTSAKQNHVANIAYLESATGLLNKYIESLTE